MCGIFLCVTSEVKDQKNTPQQVENANVLVELISNS